MCYLFDHDVVYEYREVLGIGGSGLDRTAVDDDPRRQCSFRGEEPAQRDVAVLPRRRVGRRYVIDGQLDAVQLGPPARLQTFQGVQHEVVEAVCPAAPGRDLTWQQGATEAPTAAVSAPATWCGPDARQRQQPGGLGRRRRATGHAARVVAVRLGRSVGVPGARWGCGRVLSPPVGGMRRCSRTACGRPAVATLTYVYSDSTAVLGPLATYAEPHCYDLCAQHAERLTAPRGWEVVRLAPDTEPAGPSHDDLLALADAVREAARPRPEASGPAATPRRGSAVEVGRRGHLRVLRDPR
jgi:hypothetical protein